MTTASLIDRTLAAHAAHGSVGDMLASRAVVLLVLATACRSSTVEPDDDGAPEQAAGRGGTAGHASAGGASAGASAGAAGVAAIDAAARDADPERADVAPRDAQEREGPLVLVASGLQLRRVVSLDGGKTWIGDATSPSTGCKDMGVDGTNCDATAAAVGAGIILVGNAQSVLTSRDGTTWKQVEGVFSYPIDVHYLSAAYGGGRLVVGTKSQAVSTTDGETWVTNSLRSVGSWRMTYGNGRFVGVEAKTITSTDGLSWSVKGFGLLLLGVGAGNGRFIAVGDPGSTSSTDGLHWTPPHPVRPTGGGFSAIGYLDGRWIACGSGDEGCWASTDDGETWAPHSKQSLRWLTVADGHFWGVLGSKILRSSDGATWDVVYDEPGPPFARIAAGRL